LLYNASPFTGVNLGADLVVRLAEHPNIVGVKDTSGNIVQIAEIARMAPKDFATLAGSGSFFLPTLAVGGVGGILALANVAADLCVELYDRFQDGDLDAARRLHQRLLPVNAVVTSKYGIAGLKAALDLLGFVGGLPRPPLRPLTPEQHEDVRRTLTAAELI
ncbi:MAG TPA: dihydrodipicolinate synthase family protein, partial [Chloroflexota bacterium]